MTSASDFNSFLIHQMARGAFTLTVTFKNGGEEFDACEVDLSDDNAEDALFSWLAMRPSGGSLECWAVPTDDPWAEADDDGKGTFPVDAPLAYPEPLEA